ncbi:hypothetical protein KL925_000674 [Ogataea polymorpha]|uniref:uncharacterized protein n=1 Tax=Ogataea polymorpha TaxID=460523 RepID=UPI0007F52720|nr:uncharacterized protein OGAPODRAFT_94575 [Ogataea polymorpha]KAG7883280.1 hypothetical protein KL937_000453 [Ogataea polymorpha]KAG7895967.1 hypothetical protein KL936_000675 [Ogataea polymorpha]KAG7929932.1 hypothetical protein KL925_000674 [Ogataea polymorpha]KAG7940230.1 hypothetical protein KL904_000093 [Ogataea polymorpha]OBA14715.1 hypothetical protein OGAPODRAFT_94575 [Ogataea polymorpha]
MPEQPKKVQGVVNKSFNTIPCGDISVKDLKDIYSCLLYCLNLKAEREKDHKLLKLAFKTNYPYSFSLEKGLATMQKLRIHLENTATCINISYEVKAKTARDLLQLFMNARLLHAPEDKTRSKLKSSMLLQPTPKGVAILSSFCSKYGIRGHNNVPQILKSNLNSMELISFERNSRTGAIVHSEYWNKVLFVHLMGPTKNFWSPNMPPDELPDLSRSYTEETFGTANEFGPFEMASQDSFYAFLNEKRASAQPVELEQPVEKIAKDPVSPFHHRFFTNPDSDSHVQYYVSSKGVRLFHNKVVEKPDGSKENTGTCFTGKALVQWLLDCTDVFSHDEAVKVAGLLWNLGLFYLLNGETFPNASKFIPRRNAYYFLTKEGRRLVPWTLPDENLTKLDKESETWGVGQQSLMSQISLKDVLEDPGMKYQFRTHLVDEFSVENLDVYNDIQLLEKKFKTLKKLLKLKEREKMFLLLTPLRAKRKATISAAVIKLSTDCLSDAFNIYTAYLAQGAPFELNINSRLRTDISRKMVMSEQRAPKEVKLNAEIQAPTPPPRTDIPANKKDPSQLTLDLQSIKLVDPPTPSPTDNSIAPILESLAGIMPLYEEVKSHVFELMAKDSLPKFLESDILKELPVSIIKQTK